MRRQKSNKITIEDRKNLHPKTNIKSTANRNLFYGIWIFFNRENTKLIHFKIQYTFLPCMFCFPNSDHVMFSREFAFCLFINYAFICMWMHVHKTKFEKKTVLWGTIRWSEMGKKTYNLKNSIVTEPRMSWRNEAQTILTSLHDDVILLLQPDPSDIAF